MSGCELPQVMMRASSSLLDSLSGDADPVTTVGIGAVLIALFGLLKPMRLLPCFPKPSAGRRCSKQHQATKKKKTS